jgi:hypothetical protein
MISSGWIEGTAILVTVLIVALVCRDVLAAVNELLTRVGDFNK